LIVNAKGKERREIRFSVPIDLAGGTLTAFDWDVSRRRFMLAVPGGSTYELDETGRLTRLPWLEGYALIGNGAANADGSKFVFADGSQQALVVADFRHRSLRTIARSVRGYSSPVLSPDGKLVAYTQGGPVLQIARASDGRVLKTATADATVVFPLAWLDDRRVIVVEQSPDLRTGERTQALMLGTIDGGPSGEATLDYLASGGIGFNYVGWLK
jgi:hypothetical protein